MSSFARRFAAFFALSVGLTTPAFADPVKPASAEPEKKEPTFDPESLKPYFTDKTVAAAAATIQSGKGNMAAALKQLPAKVESPQLRYLRAQALLEAGDDAGAARAFEEVANQYPALSARSHCLAAEAFERIGDSLTALKHYGPCASDPVRGRSAVISKARLLSKLGRHDDALAALSEASAGIRVEAMAARAQLLTDIGRAAEALDLYRDIYFGEPLSPFADRAKERARDLAKRLKAPPPSPERQALRVEKLFLANKTKPAIAAARELPLLSVCAGGSCAPTRCQPAPVITASTNDLSDEAIATNESVELPPELETAVPAKPFTLAKAKDSEDSATPLSLPKCAVQKIDKPADAGACRVQLVRGWVAKKQKDHGKALALLRPVYEHCTDPEVRAQALNLAAGSAEQEEDADAYDLALIAAVQFPSAAAADDALMTAAGIAKNAGDGKAERAALRQLVKNHPDSDFRSEALFRLFWSHRMEGRPDRGLAYLDMLAKEFDGQRGDGADSDRGRYWWGRTVAASARKLDRPQGLESLAKLSRERPFTFYGVLARSFLFSLNAKVAYVPESIEPSKSDLRLGLLEKDVAFQSAVELYRMGDLEETRTALGAIDFKALRADGMRGQESILIVAELIQRMGDIKGAHALARRDLLRIIREGSNPIGRRAARVCYPLVFRQPIVTNTTKQGFDANFLQGLMREESALDPRAKSPVGARGLTQVMPATARQVAHSVGMKRFRVDELWEPETNIQIGSIYLGRMLKQFGHPGLAAAAYNAGPNNVKKWLLGPKVPFDEFVERIPFSETRGYVKRVLRSYATYQMLYEGPKASAVQVSMLLRSPTGAE
jgi:soluble lytic murein transglycosylase-like protein/TolA-binding protein